MCARNLCRNPSQFHRDSLEHTLCSARCTHKQHWLIHTRPPGQAPPFGALKELREQACAAAPPPRPPTDPRGPSDGLPGEGGVGGGVVRGSRTEGRQPRTRRSPPHTASSCGPGVWGVSPALLSLAQSCRWGGLATSRTSVHGRAAASQASCGRYLVGRRYAIWTRRCGHPAAEMSRFPASLAMVAAWGNYTPSGVVSKGRPAGHMAVPPAAACVPPAAPPPPPPPWPCLASAIFRGEHLDPPRPTPRPRPAQPAKRCLHFHIQRADERAHWPANWRAWVCGDLFFT
jgi:hypothetical protein